MFTPILGRYFSGWNHLTASCFWSPAAVPHSEGCERYVNALSSFIVVVLIAGGRNQARRRPTMKANYENRKFIVPIHG